MTSNKVIERLTLQLPPLPQRPHDVRCPVLVHEFPEGELGVSYQGRLLARYDRAGQLLPAPAPRPAGARKAQQTGTTHALSSLPIVAPRAALRVASTAGNRRAQPAGKIAPPAAPPAVLHTPEGRAVPLRAWEQLPTLWTGTHATGNHLLPRRARAIAPSTMWTAACAIIQHPNYAREERLIKHQTREERKEVRNGGQRQRRTERSAERSENYPPGNNRQE